MKIRTSQINAVVLFIILCWILLPVVSHYAGSIGFVLLFVFWLLTSKINLFMGTIRKGLPFIIWYLALLILNYVGIFSYGNVNALYFFTMTGFSVIPFFVCSYYINLKDEGNNGWIIKIILLLSIVTFISTIIVSLTYPDAPKTLAMGTAMDRYKEVYVRMNCGGYGFVYGFVISFIPVLSCKFGQRFWKIIKGIYLILGILTLIISQYTIGIIVLAVSTALYILYNQNRNESSIVIKLIFVILGLIVLLNLSVVLNYLSELLSNYLILSVRLAEMASFIQYGSIGNNINSRLIVYSISWEGFLRHPLFGGAIWGQNTIGAHSTILDLLSLIGLFGMVPYFGFLLSVVKMVKRKQYTISFVSFILISILNPTIYVVTIGFAFYMSAIMFTQYGEMKNENC